MAMHISAKLIKGTRPVASRWIRDFHQAPRQQFAVTRMRCASADETSVAEMLSMRGKNVLITGGARGIGFGIIKAIAQIGGNVVCLDTLPEPVEEFSSLSDKYGIKTHYFRTDVTNEQSLTKSFQDAVDAIGDLHGCLTAAGIALDKPFQEHTWEESRRVLDVNCIGTFFSVQLAAKQMARQGTGGSIVTIASIAAQGKAWSVNHLEVFA
ncbi:MAG: hypothetical protein M1822_004570 [Bathelium mastoideum]|nr:MAG: hypothetical protein M1822_004570 [Bathelium mastoideum]